MNTFAFSAENLLEIGLVVLRYGKVKSKVRSAFIQAGAFIQQNRVFKLNN